MLESLDTLHYHFHLLRVSLEDSVYVCDFFADPDIVSSTVAPSQKSVWAIITLFTDLPTARITLARLVFFSLLSFSLIKKAAMDNTYSVHSLVHSWSRDSGQRREGYFFAHNLLSSLIDLVFACEDYTFRRTLVPHIKPASQRDALLGTSMAYDDEQCTNYGPVFFEVGYWNEREHGKPRVDVLESGTVERSRAAGCEVDKGGPRGGTSRCADEHGEPHVDVQQSGTVEGGKTAAGSSLGGEKDRRPHEKCCQSARQAPWTYMSL